MILWSPSELEQLHEERAMAYLDGLGHGDSPFVKKLRAEVEACFTDER